MTSLLSPRRVATGAATFIALCMGSTAAFAQTTLTFAHIFQPGHSAFVGAETFAERVAAETEGRVTVNVVPAGALGGMDSSLEALSLGSVHVTFAGESYTSQYFGPMGVTAAPYAFTSPAHFDAYLGSDLYQEMTDGFTQATGNAVIGTFTTGFRQVTANKAIREPADMAGLKIRVPDAPLFTAMPIAVGASPTPLAFSEVYLALQQGVVDAQENALDTIDSMNFAEVQSHVNLTQHMMEPAHLVIAGPALSQLSEADQAIVATIGEEVGRAITEDARSREAALIEKLTAGGVTIVDDVNIAAFAAAVLPFNTAAERAWTPAHFEQLQALATE